MFPKGRNPLSSSALILNSTQGYSGSPNVQQGQPGFSQRQGKEKGGTTPTTPPGPSSPSRSTCPTAHPQPLQYERGGGYLQWFEPFQSGVRSGVG